MDNDEESSITPEMIAAGAAAIEEYAGGSYTQWRRAVVRVWQEMHRASNDEPHSGGETFALAYDRNIAMQKSMEVAADKGKQKRDEMAAAAKLHGFHQITIDPQPAELAEIEWQEWFKANA